MPHAAYQVKEAAELTGDWQDDEQVVVLPLKCGV